MRRANGVVSAIIMALFLVHAALGAASMVLGFAGALSWVVWAGVGLVVVHVALSIATSREQLTDRERPPSARKKRHLALKWATGAVLAAVAAAHVVLPKSDLVAALLMVVVAAALAVHLCVGAKSLLKDLRIDRRHKTALRVIICALLAAVVAVTLGCLLA